MCAPFSSVCQQHPSQQNTVSDTASMTRAFRLVDMPPILAWFSLTFDAARMPSWPSKLARFKRNTLCNIQQQMPAHFVVGDGVSGSHWQYQDKNDRPAGACAAPAKRARIVLQWQLPASRRSDMLPYAGTASRACAAAAPTTTAHVSASHPVASALYRLPPTVLLAPAACAARGGGGAARTCRASAGQQRR